MPPPAPLAFLDERPVAIDGAASVFELVTRTDPTLADTLHDGSAYVTDGVGRKIDTEAPVTVGGIYRIVISARRSEPDRRDP